MKSSEDKLSSIIAPLIMHQCWCSYQMGAGQRYNITPENYQLKSLRNLLEVTKKKPKMTPKQSHDNWCIHKFKEGWKWGPEKNAKKKTHPDLCPWNQLTEVEQNKDKMMIEAKRFATRIVKLLRSVE